METVIEYFEKARNLGLSAFEQLYAHYFLFKHSKAARVHGSLSPDIDYTTRAVSVNFDPVPGENRILVVKKNPENPFPDRLTIGRAVNCDVVIRLAFVSKVHAHLFVQAGDRLTLRDNNAANFTFHNHQKLQPGSSRTVKLGDIISFGAMDFELMNAARLYELGRAKPALAFRQPLNPRS